jgi:hypothetical protein
MAITRLYSLLLCGGSKINKKKKKKKNCTVHVCAQDNTRVWCAHTETYGFNMGFL